MKKIFLIFILLLSIINFDTRSIFAYSSEIARATPHYSHPITGDIEDSGNNPGIGQGMTENVLSPQALFETTDDGRYFLSVRYNMANYIKNESFAVQIRGEKDFYKVDAEVTAQREETKDYRLEVPSKNIIIRASFFVEPMGRDVIFYYDFSDFVDGNTDFETIYDKGFIEEIDNIFKDNSEIVLKDINSENIIEGVQYKNFEEKVKTNVVNDKLSQKNLGYSHGLLTKDSDEIKKLFYSNDFKEGVNLKEESRELGKITMAFIYMFLGLVLVFTSLMMLSAFMIFIYYKKKERELDEKREKTY